MNEQIDRKKQNFGIYCGRFCDIIILIYYQEHYRAYSCSEKEIKKGRLGGKQHGSN